jgi:hypothetical protein
MRISACLTVIWLACACSPPPATPTKPLTSPAVWVGEWSNGQYDCGGIGEKLSNDSLKIEAGQGGRYTLTLFSNSLLPPVIQASLNSAGQLVFKDQDVNGGPGSGTLTLQNGSLSLEISTLGGLIQCRGYQYQKK